VQIPDTEAPTRDLLALIHTAHTMSRVTVGPDGKEQITYETDNKGIFWQMQNVSSPYFGAFVKTYEDAEALQEDCYNHMSEPMARVFAAQIGRHIKPFKYGIEGKSSETVQDKHNNKQNLTDKIKENKAQHLYELKGERDRSLFAGLFGRKVQQDADRT
jgi:hypothetical protein